MMEQRKSLHSMLTEPAHKAYHTLATQLGVSVSSFLQILGEKIAKGDQILSENETTKARELDASRRGRP